MTRFVRRGASLKAKVNVLLLLAVVGAVAPIVMVVWLAGQFQRTIATIQVENIVPLENLHRVEEFLREVELRIPGVMADWFSGPGAKAYVETSLPHVRTLWTEISSRTYKGERAAVVKDFDEAFRRFEALLPRLQLALTKGDNRALAALGGEWLDLKPKLLKPLVALVTVARADTAREVAAHNQRLRMATGLIVAGLTALTLVLVSVTVSIRRGISPLQNTVRLLQDLAQGQGDLTTRLDAGRRDEIGELARGFNAFMDKLHGIVSHLKLTAVDVATASAQVAAATQRLSSTSQEQASSLEETAATLEEITATVQQNAESARQANELAAGSQETAQTGGQVVTAAVTSMQELTYGSRRIVEVISVIDDMAFQTNLLALNAAVEAARAGDQGRGFAVVAAEVRSLAHRSAGASKEIKALIQDSVAKTEDGAVLVTRSGQALDKIVDSVKRVTTVIAEIAAASQEQSQGIAQVGRAVAQMDETVQENAAQTEELSSAAQVLAAQARELEALVGKFKLGDGRFAPVAGALPAAGHEVAPSKAPIGRPAARRTKAVLAGVRAEAGAGQGNGVGVEEF